jgi:hypothetical protein
MNAATRFVRWEALPAFADDDEMASQAMAAKVESLIRELEKAGKTKAKGQ